MRAGLVVLVLSLIPCGAALAQGNHGLAPTRAEYSDAADRICEQPYQKALHRLYRAGRLADKGRYKDAGARMRGAGKATLAAIRELRDLTPPPEDADRVGRWLDGMRRGAKLVVEAGRALAGEHLDRSETLLKRANRKGRRAKAIVGDFPMTICA